MGYLLDHLRDIAATSLNESEVPVEAEARSILGALVKRVEAVERYLADQSKDSTPTPPAASEPAAPAAPADEDASAPAQAPTSGQPAPAPDPSEAISGTAAAAASKPEVFSPSQVKE